VDSDLDFDASVHSVLPQQRRRTQRRRLRINSAWSGEIAAGALVLMDVASVVLAGVLSDLLFSQGGSARFRTHLAASVLCGLVVFQANLQFKLYDLSLTKRRLQMIERVFLALLAAFGGLAIIAYGTGAPITQPSLWKAGLFLFSFVLLVSARLAFHRVVIGLGKQRVVSRNVVIVGAGPDGSSLVDQLESLDSPWTRILCAFDDRARSRDRRVPRHLNARYPVHGTVRDLVSFARRVRVDDIFIALPWTAQARITQIIHAIGVIPANVHLCPEIPGHVLAPSVSSLDGLPVVTMSCKPLSGWSFLAKWSVDKLLAAVALLLLSPLLLLVALAIKLDSPGPVFFRQPRLGFNNRLIKVYKFRSMYSQQSDFVADRLTTRDDPRVTRLGRFLRRFSIDELPQLINVLLGDMSLVGPRPHALKAKAAGQLYHEVVAEYALRHKIRPGITGWAQISGWRGETDTEEKIIRRVEHDLFYMNNWSILFDLYILAMTVVKVPFHKDAY
jgi:polysaccharide biosynthesis protein PslA